ncbi:uncharacterized protein LOC117335057 [Pecten maximus]|uniref:uncharacterized protein LOC117335057 n=1 Tax=Pecten maximus TaxID=6579 RepID=UPI0014583337|nr:uncharacterized protein LOC117335057 [Pecten maximus]
MLKLILLSCLVACVMCQSYRSSRGSGDSLLFGGIRGNRWGTGLDRLGSDLWDNDALDRDTYGNDWNRRGGRMWRNRRGNRFDRRIDLFDRRADRFDRRADRFDRRADRFNRRGGY